MRRNLWRVVGVLLILAAAKGFAAVFPKPEPERAFAELKVFDAAGRPWRVAREDWAGARNRVRDDPAWGRWLQAEKKEVDAWMARHRDRVEWVAGWSHDGVSPKDASRVIWNDRIPREEVRYFASPSDPQIEITDKLHAWWVVTFRGRHVETMVRAARLHRLTGEARYAVWVAAQMDFYAENFERWAPQREGARLFWQTLTEASNLVKFTEAVRLLGEGATAERRERWRTTFFLPEVAVLNRNFQSIHNIATWQRCAVAQVALLFGDAAMWRDALDGKFGLRAQLARGVTSDYLWHEQSLGYNSFVVKAVLGLFVAAGLHGRADELAVEMSIAQNLMLAPIYLRFPDGKLPNPADSGTISTAPNRDLLAETYRVLPTTIGLEAAAGRRDWDALLDPPPASPRPVVLPAVTSRSLESSRMAVLKDAPWQVFVHYGQIIRSHAQAEALNYVAYLGATDITHDPGTVGYGSPLHRGYYTRGLNHNVPLVNGEGPVPPQSGELIEFSAAPARVVVAQPNYRPDAQAKRRVAIEGTALVDVVEIASTRGAQRLGLALHLQGKAQLTAAFAAVEDFAAGRPTEFSQWRDVRAAQFPGRAELDVDYGGGVRVRVALSVPGGFTLWHGSSPDTPPKRRESLYLELAAPAERAEFRTEFVPLARP
jgi:hypothetical protein